MSENKQLNLPNTSPEAAAQAREQAAEYDSIFASTPLELKDGDLIEVPPHPNLRILDDDRLADYEELLFEAESYDRGPDIFIPEQKVKDRAGNEITLPAETRPGPLLEPYRKNKELIKPPYNVRAVKAVLGEDDYQRLRAGGKSAADVWRIWNKQGMKVAERQAGDSKSAGSTVDSAPVPSADTA